MKLIVFCAHILTVVVPATSINIPGNVLGNLLNECNTLGVQLSTRIPTNIDPNNLGAVCSTANLELFKDVVAKCTGNDDNSKAFATNAERFNKMCSGGGTGGFDLSMINCDQALQGNKQKCKDAIAECTAKANKAEQKTCWDGKADAIMNGSGGGGAIDQACARAPRGKKQRCKDAMAECMTKTGDDAQKACVDSKVEEIMKEAMPTPEDFCAQAPEGKKKKCKDAIAECMGKATETEQDTCWDGKKKELMKEATPKIAEKGTDCSKIPEKSKLSKDSCVQLKESLRACASKAGLGEKIKKCAGLRNKQTRRITKKLVKFAQKVKGIDFSKDDEATNKKKAKYEKTVLKLFKAISGIFTYTKDNSRMRRKLNAGTSFTVNADLNTNSEAEADAAQQVDAAAISNELKTDDDFQDVTLEAPAVQVEEVEVEEEIEETVTESTTTPEDTVTESTTTPGEAASQSPGEGAGDTTVTTAPEAAVSVAASTTITFAFGLVSMMAF